LRFGKIGGQNDSAKCTSQSLQLRSHEGTKMTSSTTRRSRSAPTALRPIFLTALLAALAAAMTATLSGCGGGGSPAESAPAPIDYASLPGASSNKSVLAEQIEQAGPAPTSLPLQLSEASAVRFLNQATFGSTEAETAAAQRQWRTGWLETQFAMPVGRTHWQRVLDDQAALLAADPSRDPAQLPVAVWDWSIYEAYLSASDQLRKRVGYALSQILVVSVDGLAGGGTTVVRLAAGYMDVLEKGAFGNFRELLEDVTLSPAMGYYLSHRGNRKAEYPGGDTRQPPTRVPDENYAREVMQLFTIGLYDLNPDGTLKLSNGKPKETYGEEDVRGLARVFTGWDIVNRSNPDWPRTPMQHTASLHAPEEKRFLGVTIPAGTSGPASLRIALDMLFRHPNTAPFISHQLIQRLVTSNPSPAYVGRVAARFVDNGQGVRGDMKAVVDAVLQDPEARSLGHAGAPNSWGKLREPVLRYTTFARNFGARNNAGEIWRIASTSDPATALGQSPLRSPSVFNFYRPGYVPPNTVVARAKLVAPEFQITTDTSVPGFVNFMQRQLVAPSGGLSFNFEAELRLANDPPALVDRLNRRLTHGAMGSETRSEIVAAVTALPSGTTAQQLARVHTAILMTVASPEFIVQK
jgi:uncharacterized protein (DUF1800 family)